MEEVKRKTKLEILKETVDYYFDHPMGIEVSEHIDPKGQPRSHRTCVYLGADGRKCAHGRCIQHDLVGSLKGTAAGVIGNHPFGDDIHKPEYRGHELTFWSNLQSFHDFEGYWEKDKKGHNVLTEAGKVRYEELSTLYS